MLLRGNLLFRYTCIDRIKKIVYRLVLSSHKRLPFFFFFFFFFFFLSFFLLIHGVNLLLKRKNKKELFGPLRDWTKTKTPYNYFFFFCLCLFFLHQSVLVRKIMRVVSAAGGSDMSCVGKSELTSKTVAVSQGILSKKNVNKAVVFPRLR